MYEKVFKLLILVPLAGLMLYFSFNPLTAPIKDGLTFQAVLGSLGGIFIIVLLVERVTEIVISIWRQSGTDQLKSEIESLVKDSQSSESVPGKQMDLAKYQAETKSIALLVGFSISVIVCCAGVGLLSSIIDFTKGNQNILRGVDIVLTSGLIAGGSDGFHQFVSTLETFFDESRKRMENKS